MNQAIQGNQSCVDKTIRRLITRQDEYGRSVVIMMQFTDGSCFEFVSPRSSKLLNRSHTQCSHVAGFDSAVVPQMALFANAS